MTKTRLETNFIRLLDQCKHMANNGKHSEWRFEKYISTLEEQLAELRKSPMQPDKEIFDEYIRSVLFLKGLNITEKLPLATDKVVASQFLSPSSSPYGDSVSKEIHHKVSAQYTNQVRDELMKTKPAASMTQVERDKTQEFENPTSILRQRKTELLNTMNISTPPAVTDFDTIISNEQQTQEKITTDLLLLTRTLKEQASCANTIVKQDLYTLEKSNALADGNESTLLIQTSILKERSGFGARCWVWVFLILVVCCFIGNFLFNDTLSNQIQMLNFHTNVESKCLDLVELDLINGIHDKYVLLLFSLFQQWLSLCVFSRNVSTPN